MAKVGHEHDLEAMQRTANSWCDDATANRISKLAEEIREELHGVHSGYRRMHMAQMVVKKVERYLEEGQEDR